MKRVRKLSIAVLLVVCLCVNTILSSNTTHVSAATDDGLIYGADIGYLSQLENLGVKWVDDNGVEKDALVLLKEKGVNAVRLRVFVKPPEDFTWTKPDGSTCILGYADTEGLLYTARLR